MFGVALAIVNRSPAVVGMLIAAGTVLLVVWLLVGRASEGTVEASGGGFKISWKEELTRHVGEVLEAETKHVRDHSGTGASELAVQSYSAVHYADVNNDGQVELLVEHPVGAHSRVLKVFGWAEDEFGVPEFDVIEQINCGLGGHFTIGDLDADGKLEVAQVDVDWSKKGAFSAGGPYVELLYRWSDASGGLEEIGRKELGSPADFSKVGFTWYEWKGPVA